MSCIGWAGVADEPDLTVGVCPAAGVSGVPA